MATEAAEYCRISSRVSGFSLTFMDYDGWGKFRVGSREACDTFLQVHLGLLLFEKFCRLFIIDLNV